MSTASFSIAPAIREFSRKTANGFEGEGSKVSLARETVGIDELTVGDYDRYRKNRNPSLFPTSREGNHGDIVDDPNGIVAAAFWS